MRCIVNINDINQIFKRYYSGLMGVATDGSYPENEYKQDRELILATSELNKLIPAEITQHYTAQNFRRAMQEKGGYAPRRQFITESLQPAVQYIDGLLNSNDSFSLNEDFYEMCEPIGNGGFGMVYKYRHKLLDMDFAIKVFEPVFVSQSEAIEGENRFFREAKMLFHLRHENIVSVYDIGRINNKPFIRLEYIDGQTLKSCMEKIGGVSFERSKKPIKGILAGLKYAHEIGVIHRDLKPSNVMITKDGTVKIIDFGISAYIEINDHTKLTKTGEELCGGLYQDPCLISQPSLRDVRSDIYSLGALWFFILTNRDPSTDARQVLLNSGNVTPAQADIVFRYLKSNADERFQNCKEIWELLFSEINVIERSKPKRFAATKNITNVTRMSIMKLLDEASNNYGNYNATVFWYNGELNDIDFLKRLYPLDTMASTDPRFKNFESDIIQHTINNDDWVRNWIFKDERLALINGEDDCLLRVLCEMFHPEVRDWRDETTKNISLYVLDSLNNLLGEDGYEIYEVDKISGRPVFSYRYCI